MNRPVGYSPAQIALHWVVALILVPQFILNDDIGAAFRATMRGTAVEMTPLAWGHIIGGSLILVLVVWRLVLRGTRGAPPPPEGKAGPATLLAVLVHVALYLVLLVLAGTGLVAWFGGVRSAAEVHEALKLPLLLLVALHVLGALYNQFVLKNGLLSRMARADRG